MLKALQRNSRVLEVHRLKRFRTAVDLVYNLSKRERVKEPTNTGLHTRP